MHSALDGQQARQTRSFCRAAAVCAGAAAGCEAAEILFRRLALLLLSAWQAGAAAASASAYDSLRWALSLAAGSLALALPAACVLRAQGRSPAGWLRRPRRGMTLPALGVYLGLSELCNLAAAYVGEKTGSEQSLELPQSGAALFWAFLAVCAAPPLLEELFFRGVLQGTLRRYGAWAAIFCQAILFALLHGSAAAAFFALPAGLFFGYLAECSGSLLPGMLLHCLNNSIAFGFAVLRGGGLDALADALNRFGFFALPLVGAAALLYISRHARQKFVRLMPGVSPLMLLRCPVWDITVAFLTLAIVWGW